MTHPFRFGVQIGGALGAREFVDLARRVEGLGYSTLYMPDHFVDTDLAPMVGLSMAAAVTSDLRVSALVFANDYKHPAVLAKEIATLDVLSDGRVDLGIGAGWMQVDYDQLGLPYDRPGVRIARLAEALAVIEEQVRDFAEHGPTEDELDKARKYLIGSYPLRFDTSTKIASQLVNLQLDGLEPSYLDERNGRIAAVSLEDCKHAAKKLLGDGGLLVTMAGRPAGA